MPKEKATKKPKRPGVDKKVKKFDLIVDLLLPLQKSKNKSAVCEKFTKKDGDAVCEKALQEGLVEKRTDKNKPVFYLTLKGEMYALFNLPMPQKWEQLSNRLQQMEQSLGKLEEECRQMREPSLNVPSELCSDLANFQQIAEEAATKMKDALQQFQNLAGATARGQEYLARIQAVAGAVNEKFQQVYQEHEIKLTDLRQQIAGERQRILDDLESLRREVVALKKATASAKITAGRSESTAPEPDKKQIFAVMERAYRRIVAAKHLSQLASLPELYEQIHQELPALSIERFKTLLNELCADAIVDLHSVNDKGSIQNPEFVIKTYLGDIYYVSWR